VIEVTNNVIAYNIIVDSYFSSIWVSIYECNESKHKKLSMSVANPGLSMSVTNPGLSMSVTNPGLSQ
jgi:hypothetical protein